MSTKIGKKMSWQKYSDTTIQLPKYKKTSAHNNQQSSTYKIIF
jgi:hypothetical protein